MVFKYHRPVIFPLLGEYLDLYVFFSANTLLYSMLVAFLTCNFQLGTFDFGAFGLVL